MKSPVWFLLTAIAWTLASCDSGKKSANNPDERVNAEGRTALMEAVSHGKLAELDAQLDAGATVHLTDQKGHTALSLALEERNLAAFCRLLQAGASANQTHPEGGALVAYAFQHGHLAAVQLLLQAGADVNARTAEGKSLAHLCCERKNLRFLRWVVDKGAKLKTDDSMGVGLVHTALDHGGVELAHFLLQLGLDVDREGKNGNTVAHRVVREGYEELLPLLVKLKADFNQVDSDGYRPLHLAVRHGKTDIVDQLLKAGAAPSLLSRQGDHSTSALEMAFDRRALPLADRLLAAGAEPRDELYEAVSLPPGEGYEMVSLLMKHKADTLDNRPGDSPLACAVREGKGRIAELLLEAGADPKQEGQCGQPLLNLAVAQGNAETVKLLLEYGADPNQPFNASPSEEFLKHVKSPGVAKWALKGSENLTPLMVAADSGRVEVAEALMKAGAAAGRSARVNGTSFWPLFFAARRQDTDMQQVLFGQKPGNRKRWVKVNLKKQKLYLHHGDEVVFTSPISSGRRGNRTKTGHFVISNKYRMWTSTLYDSKMPYFQRLSGGDFGFHYGVLPGYPASHGCIRMPMSKAKELYSMTRPGDYVRIVK